MQKLFYSLTLMSIISACTEIPVQLSPNTLQSLNEFQLIVNPHDNAPLTALLNFQTEEPSQLEITILGGVPVHHIFQGFNTNHTYNILGLYPNRENKIVCVLTTESGNIDQRCKIIEVNYPGQDVVFETNLNFKHEDGTGDFTWYKFDMVYRSERMLLYQN